MTRVLQIRRGTTTQHENFTGMPGEITFDTDARTLRVHDGVTLGGFALARADAITSGGTTGGGGTDNVVPDTGNGDNTETGGTGSDTSHECTFDINSVTDDVWAPIVARNIPPLFTILERTLTRPPSATTKMEYIFETDETPMFVRAFLVCKTPESGYAIGDETTAFGIGTYAVPPINTYRDDSGLHVVMGVGNQNLWVVHKTTGVAADITPANWRVLFRLYC